MASSAAIDLIELGSRLRELRRRYGWTRADVQSLSDGRWTATALGTYERGERMMTAAGFAALADFYRAPAATLIGGQAAPVGGPSQEHALVIDARRLARSAHDWPLLARFVANVQRVRGGSRRRLVPLRSHELPRLAAVHETSLEQFLQELGEEGIRTGHGRTALEPR